MLMQLARTMSRQQGSSDNLIAVTQRGAVASAGAVTQRQRREPRREEARSRGACAAAPEHMHIMKRICPCA